MEFEPIWCRGKKKKKSSIAHSGSLTAFATIQATMQTRGPAEHTNTATVARQCPTPLRNLRLMLPSATEDKVMVHRTLRPLARWTRLALAPAVVQDRTWTILSSGVFKTYATSRRGKIYQCVSLRYKVNVAGRTHVRLCHAFLVITHAVSSRCVGRLIRGICDFVRVSEL